MKTAPNRIKDVQDTAWHNLPWRKHLEPIESAWARKAVDAICFNVIAQGVPARRYDWPRDTVVNERA